MYANLGDRVLPTPITQITSGDGRTEKLVTPDRQTVIRPDVAYIMDDMMKDVINRGTAASAKAWGFQNVPGKTAFAGKTGTSRDGWFAGFTPELVTVVYVGFDNGDDLGMQGSDSALPIWADFMKAALALHPEWNGDWAMPAGIRRAEIDIRNGSLIRPLDDLTSTDPNSTPSPTPTPMPPSPGVDPSLIDEPPSSSTADPEIYVTNVPKEFVRTEFFISGTLPNRQLISTEDALAGDGPLPLPSQTPIEESWADSAESPNEPAGQESEQKPSKDLVTVMICPTTGMRATSKCLQRESRSFPKGQEPKEFCTLHH